MKQKEHVVVIGSGISGIVSSLLLDRKYEVTLVEANTRLGGHTNTVTVKDALSKSVSIDTGFIVFNLKNRSMYESLHNKQNYQRQDHAVHSEFLWCCWLMRVAINHA